MDIDELPKPSGFRWIIKKFPAGSLLILMPEEGYTWDFPLHNPKASLDAPFFAKSVNSTSDLQEVAKEVLTEALEPTTIIKPKVRKINEP